MVAANSSQNKHAVLCDARRSTVPGLMVSVVPCLSSSPRSFFFSLRDEGPGTTEPDESDRASFKTACESAHDSDQDLGGFDLGAPSYGFSKSCDIERLCGIRNRCRTIDFESDSVDHCNDVLDECAPSRISVAGNLSASSGRLSGRIPRTTSMSCFVKTSESSKRVRQSPAVSVSTAADTVAGSPAPFHDREVRIGIALSKMDAGFQSANASTTSTAKSDDGSGAEETFSADTNIIQVENTRVTVETTVVDKASGRGFKLEESHEVWKVNPEPCGCGIPAHYMVHDPLIPMMTAPGVEPGSYEEALSLARAETGQWVTILERSESLDQHYKAIGLNYIKRSIMNRLAVPLTSFLEKQDTVVHVHIHTPVGIRHMHADLTGEQVIDDDPDCGKWQGVLRVVDFSIPWFCNGTPVRAIQSERINKKVGQCLETRCILPDKDEGRIMLFSFELYTLKDPKTPLKTDRILRCVRRG